MERFRALTIKPQVEKPAESITVCEMPDGTLNITMYLNQSHGDTNSHLTLRFSAYYAFMRFAEHEHPCDCSYPGDIPSLRDGRGVYPCLIVENSFWQALAVPPHKEQWERAANYRFIGANETVDVISPRDPEIAWINVKRLALGDWKLDEDYDFYAALGEEDGPEKCTSLGCNRLHVGNSTKCREHHFIMIKGYDPHVRDL